MANRTVKDAHSIKGTNPQYLIEKIIRSRIYDSQYWKEECFALSAELLVDKAMELKYIGGVFGGNIKPTPFICLVLKMLQIQPEKDIIVEFIKNEDFKYVRALGAYYMRLVGTSLDCYKYLEPLLNDYRKLKMKDRMGTIHVTHMDEFIDDILREERLCDIILPRIQKRHIHEENNELDARISALDDDLDEAESSGEEEELSAPPPPVLQHHRSSMAYRDDHMNSYRDSHMNAYRDSHMNAYRDDYMNSYEASMPMPRFRRSRSREKERDRRRRSRSHDRERHRHRSRSRERRERRRSSPSGRHHHHEERRERHRGRDRENRHREKKERSDKRGDREKRHRDLRDLDLDVAEANALRAKLGLPPLRS